MLRSSMVLAIFILICRIATAQYNNKIHPEYDSLKLAFAQDEASTYSKIEVLDNHQQQIPANPSMRYKAKALRNNKYHHHKQPAEIYGEYAFTSGVWVPMGWNSVLGVHPALGFMFGGWVNRTLFELNFEARFLDAPNNYTVIYQNAPLTQKKYSGGFIGVHIGYAVACYKSTTLYMLAGCGYDGFDVVSGDDTNPSLSINVFNKNLGVGIQHFGKTGGFVGLDITYNLTNYTNPGGTLLNGDAIMIRLLIGVIGG